MAYDQEGGAPLVGRLMPHPLEFRYCVPLELEFLAANPPGEIGQYNETCLHYLVSSRFTPID
ncbi:conserved hypothetical protein [Xanthomonas citri pv. citri]|nr:conserved hypothetical protein [Xanthomonas citri pv. citri]CEE56389.1 conserved hypothetical protein [Xanthomonas citri pv. citri]CEF22241.1 conserved hypothetical protein [Xanthomonas citri pv. citri]CEH59154.1 conserved hypothetical protein [Xanthomonas citri pv. citri]CEH61344.1 conserved hypothetical protein [Xanthomonas citri pv. citri]